MARLILKSADPAAQIIELKPGVNRFGRGAGNDHPLENALVSECHCEILLESGSVFVRDLGSTNGTFIEWQPIKEAALYSGQTLHIGPVEMVLDAPVKQLAIPELPKPEPLVAPSLQLKDGYAACLNHASRHAVWECPHCARVYCHECIRKLRRVGGKELKLCPGCSNHVELSAWGKLLKGRKKSLLGRLAGKVQESLKRTSQMFATRKPPGRPGPKPKPKPREK